MTQTTQPMKPFFDYTQDLRLKAQLPEPYSEEQVRLFLSSNNARCPLNQIIYGENNSGSVRQLRRFAYVALMRPNRSLKGCNFGIYAQSGQGKSHVVRQFSRTVGIPLITIQSQGLKDTWSLFEQIRLGFESAVFEGDELYFPVSDDDTRFPPIERLHAQPWDYKIPPCVVFLDEAHAIPPKLMKAGLLHAMEPDDAVLKFRIGADFFSANTSQICWVGATTERGELFDAFANRLETTIEWQNADPVELAKIIQLGIKKRVEAGELSTMIPEDGCAEVTKYRRVPREAIGFAKKVVQQKCIMPSYTWAEAALSVAKDIGLDQWGYTKKQVAILTALGQRPIAEARLATVAQCRIEQIKHYELPELMSYTNGGPFVVSTNRGMCITEAGLAELDKRSIRHKGREVTMEHFENRAN